MAAQPCHRAVTQGVAAPQVVVEHAALLRHWAGLQERVSRQAQEQARRCAALEAELMHCRARWVLATTQMLWGLGWPSAAPPRPAAVAPAGGPWRDARQVICQTGCAGHAHPWRGDEGQCRLTGGDCDRVPPSGAQAREALSEAGAGR